MKLFAGNSNRTLAESVAKYLNIPLGKASVRRFADQEIFVEIQENVRGEDVFLLQSTSFPANDNLMELLIMIDALHALLGAAHNGGHSLFRLCPPGPARLGPRTPISAKLIANMITRSRRQPRADARPARRADPGLLRHPDRQSLFSVPVMARDVKAKYKHAFQHHGRLSPDVGGVVRARALGQRASTPSSPSSTSVVNVPANPK